jgi:multiple sugar transport system permease protein
VSAAVGIFPKGRFLQHKGTVGFLFVLPAVFITYAVFGYTVVYTLYLSVIETSFNLSSEFVGLLHYMDIIKASEFWRALRVSGIYIGGIMGACLVLGLGLALLLEGIPVARRLFRTLLFIPWIVPGFVAATIFVWMLDPVYGVVNSAALKFGLISERVGWLGNPDTALISVMVGVTWKAYPFLMLISLAALQSVPAELYDAADVDGANVWQRFRYVTLPHLRDTLFTGVLLLFLLVANSIELLYIATQGGPLRATTTLPVLAYNAAFTSWDFSRAAAMSVYLLLILLAFIIASMRMNLRGGR